MTAALRWLRLSPADAAITVAILLWALVEAVMLDHATPVGWRVTFALACTAPMAVRRRAPGVAVLIALAAYLVDVLLDVLPVFAVTPFQLLPLATYAVAAFGTRRGGAATLALAAIVTPPVLFLGFAHDAPVTPRDIVSLLVVQSVAAGAGWAARLRREDAERQASRLRMAGLDADELVREGLEDERARIARELRAIVARGLAAMEERLRDVDRADARGLATAGIDLQARASAVMTDLQRLLGVLPDRGAGMGLPVSAESAVMAARARGWPVRLVGDARGADATAGAALAAGRVVEEVLAGAPPAGAERVLVRADRCDDGVSLRLAARGPAPAALADPAGRGSVRERVRLHGGRARFVRRRRRWAVATTLPGAGVLRPRWREHLMGDLVVLGAACLVVADDARGAGGAGPLTTVLLEAGLLVLPLVLRRRAPLAAVLVIAAGAVGLEVAGVLPDYSRTPIIASLLASGTAALHIPDARAALAAAVAATGAAVAVNLMQIPLGAPLTDTPIILFMFAMAWGFGRRVRGNLDDVHDARIGRQELAAEQVRRLARAVTEERRAVARDLHDVVAHGVSMVGVLAGAAAAQAPRNPQRAREALRSARTAVAQARAEVQRLTGALGDDGPAAAAMTMADVRRLTRTAQRGGQLVSCQIAVPDPRRLPEGVVSSAYRIVQESLTNARKHAPGAATTVRIAQHGDALLVEVRNTQAPAAEADGTRRGIAGMRERARLLGGELRAAPEPDGGFAVRARLPVGGAGSPGSTRNLRTHGFAPAFPASPHGGGP